MTRQEFVRAYAERSGIKADFAVLGILDVGGRTLIALPCGCGDDMCEGWAMLSAESALGHLSLYTPEALRTAYNDATGGADR